MLLRSLTFYGLAGYRNQYVQSLLPDAQRG
jgi:hypothetical protein